MRASEALGGRRGGQELSGLDALEVPIPTAPPAARRLWENLWPQLAALAFVLLAWQLVVTLELRPPWVLPGPAQVLPRLVEELGDDLPLAIATTLRRAISGYVLALGIGLLIGLAIVRWRRLRTAVASMITGLQTMPSIAWFPFAILLFGLSEEAILFVIVLGAAPSVANGLIHGVDHIPRLLLRAGRVLGARRMNWYRFVVLPAALPSFVGGMKQAWAFAWRSLMAGELLVIIAQQPSLGVQLQFQRELADAEGMLATMIVILVIGIVVDQLVFGQMERRIRKRRGLAES
ncbi:MAG TPA: ABC transporter permease [Candidatus Limnocylindria bacterium]|nr:ABC transporter permease [Candidatus Limnocylindria bacterium]